MAKAALALSVGDELFELFGVARPLGEDQCGQRPVLCTVERRENTLRAALKRHKKAVKALTKNVTATAPRSIDLKSDLTKIRKTRETVSAQL